MTGWLVVALSLAAPPKATAPARPALDELALRIAEQALAAAPEAPLGVYVEGAPAVLARAFASALSSQLAERRKGPRVIEAPSAAEAEAIARAHDVRSLLRLSVQLEGPRLQARGDLIATWVNFWAGAAATRAPRAAALAATVGADAQVQQLAAAPPSPTPAPSGPLKLSLTPLARLSAVPAALAFGDADGDGEPELAVLQGDGVAVLDLEGRLRARADLRELPAVPSPSREPFGAIAVLAGPPRIAVCSSRKARGGVLTLKAGRLDVTAADVPELPRPAAGLNVFEKGQFTSSSTRGAVTLTVWPDGSAALGAGPARFSGAGAGSALADLDADGTPELLLSSPKYAVDGDELRVLSLSQAQALQARPGPLTEVSPLWLGATARGRAVVALGVDLDGDRLDEVVIGVWLPDGTGELLVARAVPR